MNLKAFYLRVYWKSSCLWIIALPPVSSSYVKHRQLLLDWPLFFSLVRQVHVYVWLDILSNKSYMIKSFWWSYKILHLMFPLLGHLTNLWLNRVICLNKLYLFPLWKKIFFPPLRSGLYKISQIKSTMILVFANYSASKWR